MSAGLYLIVFSLSAHAPPPFLCVLCQDTRETVSDTVGGVTFRYTAGEFFQNNAYALPLMVHHVVTQAKAPLPDTGIAPRYLVDAYCGGGLFCLSAAKHFQVQRQ